MVVLQQTDVMIIIAAFEEFVQELTVNTSVKREIQILKQLNRLAQAVQKVVVAYCLLLLLVIKH